MFFPFPDIIRPNEKKTQFCQTLFSPMFFLSCPVVYLVMRCKGFNTIVIRLVTYCTTYLHLAPEPKETGGVKARKAFRRLPMPCTVCLEVSGTVRYGLLAAPRPAWPAVGMPVQPTISAPESIPLLRSARSAASMTDPLQRATTSRRREVVPVILAAFYSDTSAARPSPLSSVATPYLSAAW